MLVAKIITMFSPAPLTVLYSLSLIGSAYINAFFRRENIIRHFKVLPIYLIIYFSVFLFINRPGYLISLWIGD